MDSLPFRRSFLEPIKIPGKNCADDPPTLLRNDAAGNRSAASSLEYQMKSLSQAEKLALVKQWSPPP